MRNFVPVLIASLLATPVAAETIRQSHVEVTSQTHPTAFLHDVAKEAQDILRAHRLFLTDQGVRLSAEEETPLTIVLLNSQPAYEAAKQSTKSRSESPRAFYAHKTHSIVTWEASSTTIPSELRRILVHEGLHHELHAALGDGIPTWLDEGMAVTFENAAILGDGRLDGRSVHAAALNRVQTSAATQQLGSFAEIFGMSREAFYSGNVQDHYAKAWSVLHFLTHDPAMRQRGALGVVLTAVRNGEDVLKALDSRVAPLPMLERGWTSHIASL